MQWGRLIGLIGFVVYPILLGLFPIVLLFQLNCEVSLFSSKNSGQNIIADYLLSNKYCKKSSIKCFRTSE